MKFFMYLEWNDHLTTIRGCLKPDSVVKTFSLMFL